MSKGTPGNWNLSGKYSLTHICAHFNSRNACNKEQHLKAL